MSPIKYLIKRTHLNNTDADYYVGQVMLDSGVSFEDLVDRVAHSNTTVSKSDVLSVLEDFMTAVIDMVADGKSVATPLAVFRAGFKGTFGNASDGYDTSRHQIVPRVRPGRRLRLALNQARVEKADRFAPVPLPKTYVDGTGGAQDSVLTPGGPARLLGRLLQYDPADPAQGIFFIAEAGGETRVSTLVVNEGAQLGFIVPTLAPGSYTIEVRTMMANTQDLRVGKLGIVLTVS